MPWMTNSIAKAPRSNPKVLWMTLRTDEGNFLAILPDSHRDNADKRMMIKIGLNPIKWEFIDSPDFSERSITMVIAPGPAIRGVARGNVAREDNASSSNAFYAVSFLLCCLCSKTIW